MMEPVIIVFIMATGFLALTIVLPIIFWCTQRGASEYTMLRPTQTANSPSYQVKALPPTASGSAAYSNQGTTRISEPVSYQIKALPHSVAANSYQNRRVIAAS
jgi:hypothetical protein